MAAHAGVPTARRNSAAYFRSQILKPYLKFAPVTPHGVFEFSPAHPQDAERNTVLRQLSDAVQYRGRRNASDVAMDDYVRSFKAAGMGGACFPNTWEDVRKTLGVPDTAEHARHLCPCCGHMWPYLPERMWGAHKKDRCPVCDALRFKGDGKPRRRCWVQSLRSVVEDMLCDADLAGSIGEHRTWDKPGTYWNSPAARDLDRCCRGRLSNKTNSLGRNEVALLLALGTACGSSAMDICSRTFKCSALDRVNCCAGGDGGQLFKIKTHSSVLFCLRCMDVAPDGSMSNSAVRIVAIVEGPKELPNWDGVLSELVDDFHRHDPSRGVHFSQLSHARGRIQLFHDADKCALCRR